MTMLVDLPTLKDRLILAQVPDPILDPDLERLDTTASQMVIDRCIAPLPTPTPEPVKQVVIMLSVRLRMQEIGNYAYDAAGRMQPLWTQDLTDILGTLIADVSPQLGLGLAPSAGVMSTQYILPVPSGWPNANDPRYSGSPYPPLWWGGRR